MSLSRPPVSPARCLPLPATPQISYGFLLASALMLVSAPLKVPAAPPIVQSEAVDASTVRLGWDVAQPDFVLQRAEDFGFAENWGTYLLAPALEGSEIVHYLPAPGDPAVWFYRLKEQETSGVEGGLNFLYDSQDDFNVWNAESGAALRDTMSAVAALQEAQGDPDALAAALDGVGVLGTRNHDETARLALVLAIGDREASGPIGTLLLGQAAKISNTASPSYPGSGWGLARGFAGSVIDTALALRAMKEAGIPLGLSVVDGTAPVGGLSPSYSFEVPAGATGVTLLSRGTTATIKYRITPPGSGPLTTGSIAGGSGEIHIPGLPTTAGTWTLQAENFDAVEAVFSAEVFFTTADGIDVSRLAAAQSYLGNVQNADGGWGIGAGADSHLLATAEAVLTLACLGPPFAEAMDDGAAWLLTKKNGDAGFSSEPAASNLQETGLAAVALRSAGYVASLNDTLDYLRNAQLLNGSWDEDPYLTSLAVRVLAYAPTIAAIPDESVVDPAVFTTIPLDDYVTDLDHTDAEITWTASIPPPFNPNDADAAEEPEPPPTLAISIVDRVATITYPSGEEISQEIVFTATDPDGLSASATATFTVTQTPPFDYSIARGSFVTDSHTFTTDSGGFASLAFYTVSPSGVPSDVVFSDTGASSDFNSFITVNFKIDVGGAAPLGIHTFTVQYGAVDTSSDPITPLFDNIDEITIEVTP